MLITNFLAAVPDMVSPTSCRMTYRHSGCVEVFGDIQGDTDWLLKEEGPPPPVGSEHIHVRRLISCESSIDGTRRMLFVDPGFLH